MGTNRAKDNANAVQRLILIPCDLGMQWYWMSTRSSLGCVSYPQMKVQDKACNAHPGTKDGPGVMTFPPRIHVRLPGFKERRG